MVPIRCGWSEEERFAGDDQHTFFFEPQIDVVCGERAVFEPEPEEQRSVGFVESVGEMIVELLLSDSEGVIPFGAVERGDDVITDGDDGMIGEQVGDDGLSDIGICETGYGHHGLDGFRDFWWTDDEGGAGTGEAQF